MAISLRVIVLLMVIVVGIAAAVISLVPVRNAGLSAVRSTADLLRGEISQRLAGDLLAYFQAPMYGISSLRDQHATGQLVVTDRLTTVIPAVSIVSKRLKLPVYIANPGDEFCYASSSGTYLWYVGPYWNDTYAEQRPKPNNNSAIAGEFDADVNTTTFKWDVYFQANNSGYKPTKRPWYNAVSRNQSWGPVYVNYNSVTTTSVSPGGPMVNVETGALEGVAVVDVRNDFILDYFATVSIAKTGRAMLLHTDSRRALGGNWNESTVVSINGTYSDASRLAGVKEIREPLFAATVAALGEDGLFNTTLPHRTQFGKGSNVVYVDIVQIADDFGLDLRLMVMIPEKDFLEEVYDEVNVVVAVVCCSVFVLLIIAFIITALILQPLSTLEERIYCAASFQEDEDEDQTPSAISEVANIQTAFKTMSGELKKVKSYLPQSILAKLENDKLEREEEDAEEEDEGEVGQSTHHGDGAAAGKAASQHSGGTTSRSITASNRYSDSASQMSRRSHKNNNAMGSHGAHSSQQATARQARGLFADDTNVVKKVSVVFVNMLQSHKKLDSNWRGLKRNQLQLLEALQIHSKKFKGVVDNFQGDHVVVTFNAVIGVASHQSKAAHFALALIREFSHGFTAAAQQRSGSVATSVGGDDGTIKTIGGGGGGSAAAPPGSRKSVVENADEDNDAAVDRPTHPLTIGIAAGDCLVGNMGTDGFKRFNVIGAAFTNAMILERLAKVYSVPILTNHATAGSMGFDTYVDALGATELPTTASNTKPTVLYVVRATKTNTNDEWMYDLRAKEENDLGNGLNQAWMKFVSEGPTPETKQAVKELISKCAASRGGGDGDGHSTKDAGSEAAPIGAAGQEEQDKLNQKQQSQQQQQQQVTASLSARQRTSLQSLADAVNSNGATLSGYLENQGNRYFKQALLPLSDSVKVY